MATTWTHSPNEVSATFNQASGETAASWYSLGAAIAFSLVWESFDNVNWENITVTGDLENWEDMG